MAERISTPSKTKEIIEANRFAFKKNFGQNFLIDSNILDNIAACAGVTKEDCVLEIGPGIGPLTQELCRSAKKVIAIEVDRSLQPVLAETMAGNENLEIIFGDVLKTDIRALVAEEFAGLRPVACANLPYYITTPILAALLESRAFESRKRSRSASPRPPEKGTMARFRSSASITPCRSCCSTSRRAASSHSRR